MQIYRYNQVRAWHYLWYLW